MKRFGIFMRRSGWKVWAALSAASAMAAVVSWGLDLVYSDARLTGWALLGVAAVFAGVAVQAESISRSGS